MHRAKSEYVQLLPALYVYETNALQVTLLCSNISIALLAH